MGFFLARLSSRRPFTFAIFVDIRSALQATTNRITAIDPTAILTFFPRCIFAAYREGFDERAQERKKACAKDSFWQPSCVRATCKAHTHGEKVPCTRPSLSQCNYHRYPHPQPFSLSDSFERFQHGSRRSQVHADLHQQRMAEGDRWQNLLRRQSKHRRRDLPSAGGHTRRNSTTPVEPLVYVSLSQADVDKAVEAARKAFDINSPWRKLEPAARGTLMRKFAELLRRDLDYLSVKSDCLSCMC